VSWRSRGAGSGQRGTSPNAPRPARQPSTRPATGPPARSTGPSRGTGTPCPRRRSRRLQTRRRRRGTGPGRRPRRGCRRECRNARPARSAAGRQPRCRRRLPAARCAARGQRPGRSGRSGLARSWHCPPIRDRTSSPVQTLNFAEQQSRGHHFGALAAAQGGQHDPEVGEIAARQPELVVDIANDIQRGPHSRNGLQVRLEHLARQVRRQPDPGGRLHRTARRLLDHGTKSSRAANTRKAC
jgi:hypothetical protein